MTSSMTAGAVGLLMIVSQVPSHQDLVAKYRAMDVRQRSNVRFLYVPWQDQAEDVDWAAAISLVVCSSSLETDLGSARPIRVAPGVLQIDLAALGWQYRDWLDVLRIGKYPYHAATNPLFVRGDWLMIQLADGSERSQAYLRLQYGDPDKLDRDKLLAILGVDRAKVRKLKLDHGMIEGKSQVAKNRIRVLEFFPTLGGYASGTKDWLRIEAQNSPLEFPDLKGIQHDGEEWIIGLPKYWPGGRGSLQSYFLADGKGNLVQEAPPRLVEDHQKFRGYASIRNPGSCIVCHREGLNRPTENALQSWLADGIELRAKDKGLAQFLDRWHLTDKGTTISRANEDQGLAVRYACYGMDQAEALENFERAVAWYDASLDLERAAAEIGAESGQAWQQVLAITSERAPIGGHLAALAHDKPIRRDVWESVYLNARRIQQDDQAGRDAKP